jgi:hypothetical protein
MAMGQLEHIGLKHDVMQELLDKDDNESILRKKLSPEVDADRDELMASGITSRFSAARDLSPKVESGDNDETVMVVKIRKECSKWWCPASLCRFPIH